MTFLSIDPASGERLQEYPAWGPERLETALAASAGSTTVDVLFDTAGRKTLDVAYARLERISS